MCNDKMMMCLFYSVWLISKVKHTPFFPLGLMDVLPYLITSIPITSLFLEPGTAMPSQMQS